MALSSVPAQYTGVLAIVKLVFRNKEGIVRQEVLFNDEVKQRKEVVHYFFHTWKCNVLHHVLFRTHHTHMYTHKIHSF